MATSSTSDDDERSIVARGDQLKPNEYKNAADDKWQCPDFEPKIGLRRYKQSARHLAPIRPFAKEPSAKIDKTGLFNYITYWWVFTYLWRAFRGDDHQKQIIRSPDDWLLSKFDASGTNMTRLEILWHQELKNPKRKKDPSLFKVVLRFFKTRLLVSALLFAFCLAFGFIGPTCLVRTLVAYCEEYEHKLTQSDAERYATFKYGLYLVLALLIVELLRVLSYGATWAISYRSGIRVRGAVLALLYKKLLHTRGSKTSAEIVNIYANDGQRLFDAITFAPLVLTGPFVLIGGIIYLLHLIGPWSLLGLLVYFIFDCFQVVLGKTMVKYRKTAIEMTEKRMSVMGELLRCIRLVKMSTMENTFLDKILVIRNEEKRCLRTAGYAQSLAIATGSCVPVIATIITFLAIIWSGNDLSASQAFSAITVYFVMMFGIRMIPYGMRYVAEASVSCRNIQKILLACDNQLDRHSPSDPKVAVELVDATFNWEKYDTEASNGKEDVEKPLLSQAPLRTLNAVIKRGTLVGVCGSVGSGKSALLQAILGTMVKTSGEIFINGNFAYTSQEPWILNTSLRENILFGASYDKVKYHRILQMCSLNLDVASMPAQDLTEIGERGVTLSGGQKARVALARCLYSARDIQLLDDVTTSLDSIVASHVFRNAIKASTKKGRTIVAVLNDVSHLSQCDSIIFMDHGQIVAQGRHEDLIKSSQAYIDLCIANSSHKKRNYRSIETVLGVDGGTDRPKSDSQRSQETLVAADSLFDIPQAVENEGALTAPEEELGMKAVASSVYTSYIYAAGGWCVLLIVLATFLINVGTTIFASVWLSEWLEQAHTVTTNTVENITTVVYRSSLVEFERSGLYGGIYAATMGILLFSSIAKAIVFVKVSLNAATHLHNRMLHRLLHASMRFFDVTPNGRILNRFSKDMDEIDVKLPFSVESLTQNLLMVVGYLIMIAYTFPWFLVACTPLAVIFYILVACFRAGIRSLKRLENNSRSPLFDHLSMSLDGQATIKAFEQTSRFNRLLRKHLDENSTSMFLFHSAMRWLAVWLDLLVVLITTLVALLMVIFADRVGAAYAGMALSFAIQMSGIFQFAVRMHAETEAKMTSVERVKYYINNIEQEPDWYFGSVKPAADWPTKGRISFQHLRLRYRDNLNFALNDVSFSIQPNEKVGIVGRTGSGKTSLCFAIFRLYEAQEGKIIFDDIDIANIGLHDLRTKIDIIPQDPTILTGTVRFNIDPQRRHTDEQIWSALEKTHIADKIRSMGDGLQSSITGNGSNLSTGERQLLCMARALLKNVNVLLLDEATSSLDAQTDSLIQACLTEAFKNCTLLIIAHRLSSVLTVDKILYMDAGKVAEFGDRQVLLDNPHSKFSQLVAKAETSAVPISESAEEGEQVDLDRAASSSSSADHHSVSSSD